MFIESVKPSNHLILCRPFLLLPLNFPSIGVFSNESALHSRWPKNWSFNFSISSSNKYLWLISFRIDWFDLPAVQGPLKYYPAPQFKSIDSSVLHLLCGCSVAKLCATLCNPVNCSKPGFPVLHYLPVCSNSCALCR